MSIFSLFLEVVEDKDVVNNKLDDKNKKIKKNEIFTKKDINKVHTTSKSKNDTKSKMEDKSKLFSIENNYTIMGIYAVVVLSISLSVFLIFKKSFGGMKIISDRLSFYYRLYLVEDDYLSFMVLQDIKIKYPKFAVMKDQRWRSVLIKHKNIFQNEALILLREIIKESDKGVFVSTIVHLKEGKLFYEENNIELSVNMKIIDEYADMIELINNSKCIFINLLLFFFIVIILSIVV